jgi:hypothetical protein
VAETNPPGWMQNAGATHTAVQMRTYLGSTLTGKFSTSEPSRSRGGVHPTLGGQLAVTQNGSPNMSVNVQAGVAYIPGNESTAQGVYFCHLAGTINLSIATAPGTGLNRIDLVVAQVQDSFYSTINNSWALAVVTGTAAASPVAPSAPNNCLVLAQVFVGANVTSIVNGNITDQRYFAAALGGTIYVSNFASLPAANLYTAGQTLWENGTGRFMYVDPSANYRELSNRFIVQGAPGSIVSGITTTETVIASATFTALSSPQRYWAKFSGELQTSVANDTGTLRLRWKNSGVADTSGTVFRANNCTLPSAAKTFGPISIDASFNAQAAGTLTVVTTLVRIGGSGSWQSNSLPGGQITTLDIFATDD